MALGKIVFFTLSRFFDFSGSIVTNEGKPRCAFASKLGLVVVDLRCITPRFNYSIGKDNKFFTQVLQN